MTKVTCVFLSSFFLAISFLAITTERHSLRDRWEHRRMSSHVQDLTQSNIQRAYTRATKEI